MDDSFTLKQQGAGAVSVTGYKFAPGGDDNVDDADKVETELWGLTVPAKKKVAVTLNDDLDEKIHVTQASKR